MVEMGDRTTSELFKLRFHPCCDTVGMCRLSASRPEFSLTLDTMRKITGSDSEPGTACLEGA